jgi:hypothetical protein
MARQVIAHRSVTNVTTFEPSQAVRDVDRTALPTIVNCRTASAVTRRPDDPCHGLGHGATRRAAF